ncbi:hypothetical protein SAMN05428995_1202 [Loktanella sp. DSM 29012]|nr:hypothetical protein SAMN05428995_1202 [Loktanella sp. DSM 29012]
MPTHNNTTLDTICNLASSWFVRQDNKFYAIDRPTVKLSRNDVEQIILHRLSDALPEGELTNDLIKLMFRRIIVERHTNREQSIPVWNGAISCSPGFNERFIWQNGSVGLNTWFEPDYRILRVNSQDYGPLLELVAAMFATDVEADLFLDWLAWCLQNESDKPFWAPFLFSSAKGTGKSTLCRIVAQLFGLENTATQNNVDQLTGRFSSTSLQSKLVVCEETHLRPGSSQGNTLKMNITEEYMMVERKGREAERIRQCCCFLFTSNHLPTWMEKGERRYHVFDVGHDGCAGGVNAQGFGELVGRCREHYSHEINLASLYAALMARTLSDHFNAKALDLTHYKTPTMERLSELSDHTLVDQLREALDRLGVAVVPQEQVVAIIRDNLGGTTNQTKYLMDDLGWNMRKLKWGGVDYARAVWHKDDVKLDAGKIYGAGFDGEPIGEYLNSVTSPEEKELVGA